MSSTNHYLLRDAQEVHGIFTTLESAYNFVLHFLYNFSKFYKMVSCTTTNIKQLTKSFQITQYTNNEIVEIYKLNNDFGLDNFEGNDIKMVTITSRDLVIKLTGDFDDTNNEIINNNLDLFIPLENFEDTEAPMKSVDNKAINDLNAKILILKEMKQKELEQQQQLGK